jgi:hypothetical protein
VTQRTVLQLVLLHLRIVHLMLAPLTPVVRPRHNRLPTDHTRRKVTPTPSTYRIVLTYRLLAVPPRTLNPLARCLSRWMLGEDTHRDVSVPFALLRTAHTLQLHKRPRTLLVTLRNTTRTLL